MKTPNLKMLLVLLAGVVIVSCIHEFSEENKPPEMNLTVQEARAAFEREADILEISPLTTSVNTRSLDDGIVITPLWDKAVNFSDTNGAYVVVPFNLPWGISLQESNLIWKFLMMKNSIIRIFVC